MRHGNRNCAHFQQNSNSSGAVTSIRSRNRISSRGRATKASLTLFQMSAFLFPDHFASRSRRAAREQTFVISVANTEERHHQFFSCDCVLTGHKCHPTAQLFVQQLLVLRCRAGKVRVDCLERVWHGAPLIEIEVPWFSRRRFKRPPNYFAEFVDRILENHRPSHRQGALQFIDYSQFDEPHQLFDRRQIRSSETNSRWRRGVTFRCKIQPNVPYFSSVVSLDQETIGVTHCSDRHDVENLIVNYLDGSSATGWKSRILGSDSLVWIVSQLWEPLEFPTPTATPLEMQLDNLDLDGFRRPWPDKQALFSEGGLKSGCK
jgi:hypothetical protein